MIKKDRLPVLGLAMLCLLAGIWSGLHRIGWTMPTSFIAADHGSIMVGGFIGTLIALEKIIPLKSRLLFLIPMASAASVPLFFFGENTTSLFLLLAASAGLSFVFLFYLWQQKGITNILMFLGSVYWVVGNALLLTTRFYPLALPWWVAFTLFVIAAERLELMKFLPVKKFQQGLFVILLCLFPAGAVLSFHGVGNTICGLALIGTATWLMRYDVIGINYKAGALHRYMAIALFCGYVSLLLCGTFMLLLDGQWFSYDVIVHCFFIGFVFSMIMAHGPLILPAVIGLTTRPYHPFLYIWLSALHISWAIRVFADMNVALDIRKFSGLLSAIAIVGYFITIVSLTIRSRRNVKIQ